MPRGCTPSRAEPTRFGSCSARRPSRCPYAETLRTPGFHLNRSRTVCRSTSGSPTAPASPSSSPPTTRLRTSPRSSWKPSTPFDPSPPASDDASSDETPHVLQDLCQTYPELQTIRLRHQTGQSGAIVAGFWASRGDWVGLLDADLQNPPAELARIWDELPGYDAALGWRVRREDTVARRLISRWANRVRNLLLRQQIRDTGCSVRIFPRSVALRLPAFNGMHRFFGTLLLREGCRVVQVPVEHRPRAHGRSHYHIWNRSLRVVIDLLGVVWLLARPTRAEFDTSGSTSASTPAKDLARHPRTASKTEVTR